MPFQDSPEGQTHSYPRVLVGVPYHSSKPYCWPLFMKSLHDILAATKNAELEIVVRFDPNLTYGNPQNVKRQREFFRLQAIDGGFDFLFLHGHDTVPTPDAIDRLLAVFAAVPGTGMAVGPYWLRPKAHGGSLGAVAWIKGMNPETKDAALKPSAGLVAIDGAGLDCALISRAALEQVSWTDWEMNDDDHPFCDRLREADLGIVADPSIQCKHYENAQEYSFEGEYRQV